MTDEQAAADHQTGAEFSDTPCDFQAPVVVRRVASAKSRTPMSALGERDAQRDDFVDWSGAAAAAAARAPKAGDAPCDGGRGCDRRGDAQRGLLRRDGSRGRGELE